MAESDWVDSGEAPPTSVLQSIREKVHSYSPGAIAQSIWQDPKGALQTADDYVRSAANAVTFGNSDRLAGAASGKGYDAGLADELRRTEEARTRSPIASTVGDITGAAVLPGFGAEALAARMGGGALARGAAYGGTGAATGAAQGAGSTYTGNAQDYFDNAKFGGAIGGVFGGVGGAVLGSRPAVTSARTPTIPEARQAKTAAYDVLNANPARYDASHLAQRGDNLEQQFWNVDKYVRRDSPSTFAALDDMRAPYRQLVRTAPPDAIATVTPGDLDIIRKGINNIPPSAKRTTDRTSGRAVKGALDDFLENPPMGAVMPGSEGAAREAATQALLARELNGAYKRSVTSDALIRRAEGKAASNYSGLNVENNLRQEYRGFTAPDRKTGRSQAQNYGFNPAEIRAMEDFYNGVDTRGRNMLRWSAKTAGGGSGIGFLGATGLGGAFLAPDNAPTEGKIAGAMALPLAGLALRGAGNRVAQRAVRDIDERLRQRSPLYQQRLAVAPMQSGGGSASAAETARDAVATALVKQRQRRDAPDEWE